MMKTLIIDTSSAFLVVGYAEDMHLKQVFQERAHKKQSEFLIAKVSEVLAASDVDPSELSAVVVTDGPGSYTGLRIGLTFAKTLALVYPDLEIYTVDALAAIAGKSTGFVFLDARSNRTFGAYIQDGILFEAGVYLLDDVKSIEAPMWGDLSLIGLEDRYDSIAENILELRDTWSRVENADTLVPRYLK